MKYFNFSITVMFITLFILSSCTKDKFEPEYLSDEAQIQEDLNIQQNEGQIILGEQLEDPYALKNMEKAYSNLRSVNPGTPNVDIKPTHKYIRFLPNDEEEWDLLKKDTTLILYDFPLDHDIVNMGTYYHDPSLPENAITWQYCVIPVEYPIPSVQNELLYEVYIPNDDDNKSSSEMKQFLIDLEYESVKLTGNLPKNESNLKGTKGLWSKWAPKGTIKVWDNLIGSTTTYTKVFDHWEYYDCGGNGEDPVQLRLLPIERCKRAIYRYIQHTAQGSYIPLIGANVHARWFTHIETDVTDENGYFQTSSFRNEVNYAIKWDRGHYDIRDGMILQAWYNGPKKKGDWNENINGGKSIMYATMHRAAYKQFYGDNLGIRRPTGIGKTKLCYIDENGTGIFWGDWIDRGILPDIKVWGKDSQTGAYKTIDRVFGTTTHELGHMSHWWHIGPIDYAQTSIRVYESWAEAVEWALTNDEYHTMGARFGGATAINYNCEWTNQRLWPVHGGDMDYTPIFIDLMDDINQRNARPNVPNDLISGYTLSYIQNNILDDAYGLSSLRDAIKNHKISGVTDADVDELFAIYSFILVKKGESYEKHRKNYNFNNCC